MDKVSASEKKYDQVTARGGSQPSELDKYQLHAISMPLCPCQDSRLAVQDDEHLCPTNSFLVKVASLRKL